MTKKANTHGGRREGAGRKFTEEKVVTSFRVHKQSLEKCKAHKVKLNDKVNDLIKEEAKKLSVNHEST